jgi:hypothetical protein
MFSHKSRAFRCVCKCVCACGLDWREWERERESWALRVWQVKDKQEKNTVAQRMGRYVVFDNTVGPNWPCLSLVVCTGKKNLYRVEREWKCLTRFGSWLYSTPVAAAAAASASGSGSLSLNNTSNTRRKKRQNLATDVCPRSFLFFCVSLNCLRLSVNERQ